MVVCFSEMNISMQSLFCLMTVLFVQVFLSSTAWTGPSRDRSHPQWEVRCHIAGHPQSWVRRPCPPANRMEGPITIRTKVPLSQFIPHVPERMSKRPVLLLCQRRFNLFFDIMNTSQFRPPTCILLSFNIWICHHHISAHSFFSVLNDILLSQFIVHWLLLVSQS